jgi:DNA-binding transcriptional regulator YhcF (GntR family)
MEKKITFYTILKMLKKYFTDEELKNIKLSKHTNAEKINILIYLLNEAKKRGMSDEEYKKILKMIIEIDKKMI